MILWLQGSVFLDDDTYRSQEKYCKTLGFCIIARLIKNCLVSIRAGWGCNNDRMKSCENTYNFITLGVVFNILVPIFFGRGSSVRIAKSLKKLWFWAYDAFLSPFLRLTLALSSSRNTVKTQVFPTSGPFYVDFWLQHKLSKHLPKTTILWLQRVVFLDDDTCRKSFERPNLWEGLQNWRFVDSGPKQRFSANPCKNQWNATNPESSSGEFIWGGGQLIFSRVRRSALYNNLCFVTLEHNDSW